MTSGTVIKNRNTTRMVYRLASEEKEKDDTNHIRSIHGMLLGERLLRCQRLPDAVDDED